MTTETKTVTVYSTLGCGYTDMLKAQLDSEGVKYEEVNLSLHPDRWARSPAAHRRRAHQPRDGGRRTKVTVGFNGIGCYG